MGLYLKLHGVCKVCPYLKFCVLLVFCIPVLSNAQNNTAFTDGYVTPPDSIKYCIDPKWYPYESLQQNQHTGISSDFMELFQAHSGIKAELVISDNWLHTIELLKAGACDLTPMLNITDDRAQFLDFSEVWYRSPNVLISLKDEPFLQGLENLAGRSVALTEGYRITDYVSEHYPKIKFTEVADEGTGIQAVLNEEVDVFIGSMLSVNNYIQINGYHELQIAGWAGPEDLLRVGVTKNNQALVPFINDFINQISEAERISMHKKWNNIAFIDNTNYALIKNVILISTLILLAGVIYNLLIRKINKKLVSQNQELTKLKAELTKSNEELLFLTNHDMLTQVYNRHYFNQVIEPTEHNFTQQEPICLVFFDIDHFKSINDIYGHTMGDMVLKSIANSINKILTDQHIFVRWGGEEFIILCQQTDVLEAKRLCQKINDSLQNLDIKPIQSITCSFGIAKKNPGESIMMCIERADRAMYQAKSNGRNQIITAQMTGS